jgi:hypothetical protein
VRLNVHLPPLFYSDDYGGGYDGDYGGDCDAICSRICDGDIYGLKPCQYWALVMVGCVKKW